MLKKQLDFDEMLMYVKRQLVVNQGEHSRNDYQSFRRRSEHCRRVFHWCRLLLENENIDDVDETTVLVAAIFHDVGYNNSELPHEELGIDIFYRYATQKKWDMKLIEKISFLIRYHSYKNSYIDSSLPIELQLLMEADLLDEEGSMGIVADCLTEGMKKELCGGYEAVLRQIKKFAAEILEYNPMVTPYAIKCWKDKQQFVKLFIECYEKDCMLN